MRPEHIAACKAVRNPKMTIGDVPEKGDPNKQWVSDDGRIRRDGYVHTDTGIVFATRSALQKAVRISNRQPNPLRRANSHRFNKAIRAIADANQFDIQELVRAEVTRAVDAQAVRIVGMFEDYIKSTVHGALGRTAADTKKHITKVATDEAKRLILENLTLDMEISGHARISDGTRRAVSVI